jgi:predicted kinase
LPDPGCRIVLLVGLPGSGKSTYARDAKLPVLSSDAVRLLLADDETDQTIHGRVFATLRYLLMQRVEIGRPVTCVDATHLTKAERKPYVEIAKEHRCSLEAVFVNTPLPICLERNRQRTRQVPDEALIAMAAKLQPPMLEEGFARIEVI